MRFAHAAQTLLHPNIHLNNAGGFTLPALTLKEEGKVAMNKNSVSQSMLAVLFRNDGAFYNPITR